MITADILDIGSRRAEEKAMEKRRMNGGSAICPSPFRFGEPTAFELPNVPDVSNDVDNKLIELINNVDCSCFKSFISLYFYFYF